MLINYVTKDLISYNKKLVYARKGDKCSIIQRRGNVLICLHENGEKFSCTEEYLSTNKIEKEIIKKK
jgi:hypothetical protein